MPVKVFEFLEQFMIGAFLITVAQLGWKNGSKCKKFLFRWKSKNEILFLKLEIVYFFRAISTLIFRDCYLRNFQQMDSNWTQEVMNAHL